MLGPVQEPPSRFPALRYAGPDDADALRRLADLDSSRPPRGVVLVAEVRDELWAAVSLDDGHAVGDPFRPTAELLLHMLQRANVLRRAQRGQMDRLPRAGPSRRPCSAARSPRNPVGPGRGRGSGDGRVGAMTPRRAGAQDRRRAGRSTSRTQSSVRPVSAAGGQAAAYKGLHLSLLTLFDSAPGSRSGSACSPPV